MAPGYRHQGLNALFEMARETPIQAHTQRFLFVRHGETEGNRERVFQRADQPLNARGLEQATVAAKILATHRVGQIKASSMPRAFVTAEVIGRPHGITPEPVEDLRERWFGDLVGTPAAGYDWRDAPPNGETLATFVSRTQRGLAEALSSDGDTTIVAHGGTLYVLGPSLGLELPEPFYANAMPLLFECRQRAWSVQALGAGGEAGNIV